MTFTELEKLYGDTGCDTFKSFITAIKKLKSSSQVTDFQLANDLGKIVENESAECSEIGLKGLDMSEIEKQRLTKATMLAAFVIILLCKIRSRTEIRNKTMLLLEYLSYLQSGNHNQGWAGLPVVCTLVGIPYQVILRLRRTSRGLHQKCQGRENQGI